MGRGKTLAAIEIGSILAFKQLNYSNKKIAKKESGTLDNQLFIERH